MMILYEEGKWSPNDPIAKYIPEFAHLKVLKGMDPNGQPILEDPTHAPTMAELMSHNAGFTYGYPELPQAFSPFVGGTRVDKMYNDANVLWSESLLQMIDKLAKIPLLYQPGTKWVYSVSVDIQGHIIEKISGKPLAKFMRENIFEPLDMKDTAFHVEAAKRSRVATLYETNDKGGLTLSNRGLDYSTEPTMPMGGAGLISTARDYLRFAQMVSNGGVLGGVRILSPSSVELMRTNRLPNSVASPDGLGMISRGIGFGFDFGVYFDPAVAGSVLGKGSYFWGGVAGTWFWIDPTNELMFVGMTQRMITAAFPEWVTRSQQTVYQSLVDPAK